MNDFVGSLITGAVGGGVVSIAIAKVLADRGEVGRRRATDRLDLAAVVSAFRGEVQSAAGRIKEERGLNATEFGDLHLVEFSRTCARLSFHLGRLQRRDVERSVRRLVGHLKQQEGFELAHIPSSYNAPKTRSWATHKITELAGGDRRDHLLLQEFGILEEAITTQNLLHFHRAEDELANLLRRLRRSW